MEDFAHQTRLMVLLAFLAIPENMLPLAVATGGQTFTKPLILGTGGAEGSRTPDLLIANETLYQLSYDPIQFYFKMLRRISK